MMRLGLFGSLVLLLLGVGSSCGINSNLMFKTPKGVAERSDSIPLRPTTEYTISRDDKFSFTLYTNGGKRIVENMAGMNDAQVNPEIPEYIVRSNGTAELPIVGEVMVAGLTVQQCEDTLAKAFALEYQEPYVQVKLTNQRVIVFPGNGSDAKVIPLQNNNTTLMEAIALAGGIADRGRADKIKLMRNLGASRVVYVLDLSTIDGLKYADMIVQANDYIYVEPNEQVGREAVQSAAPVVSLLSSALIIFTVFSNLK
jgi:polysaccharide export outer membrane protein